MNHLKHALLLLAVCLVASFCSSYFRVLLVAIESLPVYLEHFFAAMIVEGGFNYYFAYALIMWISCFTYSSFMLGAYWLMNRRLPPQMNQLIISVWFVVYVVMALGPETLAL